MPESALSIFCKESLQMERIKRPPSDIELDSADFFLSIEHPSVVDMCNLVLVWEPIAKLRDKVGMNLFAFGNFAPVAILESTAICNVS